MPAGADPAVSAEQLPASGGRERSQIRRRARKLRRLREATARDLGLLVLELQRRHRDNPELLRRKTIELRAIDDELRGLATALGRRDRLDQVVAAGIAGNCETCGALIGTDDRYCSSCGSARSAGAPPPVADEQSELAATAEPKP